MKQKKGQIGFMIGLVGFFMSLVVVSFMMGPLLEFIDVGVNATSNSTNSALIATVFNAYPVFIVLLLMIVLFIIAQSR